MTQTQFSTPLLAWFKKHGRTNLPWQQEQTPYRVWVSEIMLQQTQVNTVLPYFERFMVSFPTVDKLALAEEDTVLHHWTGLGYYARARNLHKAAKIIHAEHNSELPNTVEGLCELPGIGQSTAGAIISLASKKHAVILDGNVKRVLCRYHCIEGWPDSTQTKNQLWEIAERYTPVKSCAQYTQAIMDLGATLCTRSKPACPMCPLQKNCQAFEENRVSEFPHKKPKKKLPIKSTIMLILRSPNSDTILLEKRPPQGIWGGLWSFPEFKDELEIKDYLHNKGYQAQQTDSWQKFRHTFSHYHLDISPVIITLSKAPTNMIENQQTHWYNLQSPISLGLPAPIKNLLSTLQN